MDSWMVCSIRLSASTDVYGSRGLVDRQCRISDVGFFAERKTYLQNSLTPAHPCHRSDPAVRRQPVSVSPSLCDQSGLLQRGGRVARPKRCD